jgi:hypothetical protein
MLNCLLRRSHPWSVNKVFVKMIDIFNHSVFHAAGESNVVEYLNHHFLQTYLMLNGRITFNIER